MPYIAKNSKHKHLAKILAIIISLHNEDKLLAQISN